MGFPLMPLHCFTPLPNAVGRLQKAQLAPLWGGGGGRGSPLCHHVCVTPQRRETLRQHDCKGAYNNMALRDPITAQSQDTLQ